MIFWMTSTPQMKSGFGIAELEIILTAFLFRLAKVLALGEEILRKNPDAKEVADLMKALKAQQEAIKRDWAQKQKELQDAKDLQAFLREADQLDSVTASHEAFLDFDDLGVSVRFKLVWSTLVMGVCI
jgi:spectrin beta